MESIKSCAVTMGTHVESTKGPTPNIFANNKEGAVYEDPFRVNPPKFRLSRTVISTSACSMRHIIVPSILVAII